MKKFLIFFVKGYQKLISPVFNHIGTNCKFYPTCSNYMIQAIEKYGSIKGLYLGIRRILKCHPFAKGGYDPLK